MKALAGSVLLLIVAGPSLADVAPPFTDEPDVFAPRPEQPAYKPEGRRDPFVPLSGPTPQRRTCPLPGLGALQVEAAGLRGIVKTPSGRIALLAGPDGHTHFARSGERLCDGEVAAIGADFVAFRQEVLDPLSPLRSREVKRLLHP